MEVYSVMILMTHILIYYLHMRSTQPVGPLTKSYLYPYETTWKSEATETNCINAKNNYLDKSNNGQFSRITIWISSLTCTENAVRFASVTFRHAPQSTVKRSKKTV